MIRRVRKLALDTSYATVVIVIPAGKTVSLVVPITRLRRRLKLLPRVGERRTTLFQHGRLVFLIVALTNEGECLAERLPYFGRVWILLEDDREVCQLFVSVAPLGVKVRGGGAGQRTNNSRGELEVPLARKATTIACLGELWIKAESTLSALLCDVISARYLTHHWAAHYGYVGKTHASSFSHAAAKFERYAGVGPWILMATSYSTIALQ
jgi:hypothetical protein